MRGEQPGSNLDLACSSVAARRAKKVWGTNTYKGAMGLQFGSRFDIPVQLIAACKRDSLPSLKRESAMAPQQEEEEGTTTFQCRYIHASSVAGNFISMPLPEREKKAQRNESCQ